jgi:hypothetical protein
MSRKLAVALAMLILVGSMGLKTAVASHTDATLTASIGGAPPPPSPWRIGGAPPPPSPWKIGGAPPPPSPWK